VVLVYNHAQHVWVPDPHTEFRLFFDAFLDWRERNGWNNNIADRLSGMFRDCGLENVQDWNDDEINARGLPHFEDTAMIWAYVVETLGPRIIEDGTLTATQAAAAQSTYRTYVQHQLQRHRISMRTVAGMRTIRHGGGVREERTP
jgi:hypothetical protein